MKFVTISVIAIGMATILLISAGIVNQKEKSTISEEENAKIEAWIQKNNLNQYGDLKNRLYRGGTPLFNEGTGESLDRYEYILKNHPDRPWQQQK